MNTPVGAVQTSDLVNRRASWWRGRANESVRSMCLLAALVGIFVLAFVLRHALVPDVVPISTREPQALWALEAAFLLRATEFVALLAATLVFAVRVGRQIVRQLER